MPHTISRKWLETGLDVCLESFKRYGFRGWIIDVEGFNAGDYQVISPRGNNYDLKGVFVLRGDDGKGNTFRKRADKKEAEGEVLALARVADCYRMLLKGHRQYAFQP